MKNKVGQLAASGDSAAVDSFEVICVNFSVSLRGNLGYNLVDTRP